MTGNHLLGAKVDLLWAYPFDCTFFRPICLQDVGKEREQERKLCLTAKALRRVAGFCSCKTSIQYVLYITMRGFLVGAKLPHPCSRSLPASMQATEPEKRTLNRVQLRIPGLSIRFKNQCFFEKIFSVLVSDTDGSGIV